jgi:ATP-binding cassette subfamily F protein uup
MVRGTARHVVGYLKDFLFDEAQARAPVRSLSGGEKARLLLARIMARESNLLVLDEPTNDLDVETLDLLQETLAGYDGTVLLVSHDRDFLDRWRR